MAIPTVPLLEMLRKAEVKDADFLREALEWLLAQLMEAEVSAQIGADRYERTADRTTSRNGYRERAWETRLGTLQLEIPQLRKGSYFPNFLEPRRRMYFVNRKWLIRSFDAGAQNCRIPPRA